MVHIESGEIDLRALYATLAVTHLLGLEKEVFSSELIIQIIEAILSCQTYDGGFGAVPWGHTEAHGGYTYCAIASLVIIERWDYCIFSPLPSESKNRLLNWISDRQSIKLGGLQGRPGKLVDACYSFWIGSLPSLMDIPTESVLNVDTLKRYLLTACQAPEGGMRDKPSKYHV